MEHRDQIDPGQPELEPAAASRHLTTTELEAVIRRAVELQAGAANAAGDGIPAADVLRIGQDLGLESAVVRRAMAEVRLRTHSERGALGWFAGAGVVRASRIVQGSASDTALLLEGYLRDVELMVAQRRFADRTRYLQDTSIAAGISRFTRNFSRAHQPLRLKQLDVAVSPLDAETCLVELSVDLTVIRGGLIAGVFGSSSILAAGWTGAVWVTPLADPLLLLGVPLLAGAWLGMRAIHGTISRSSLEKIESLLDRLEHDEIG